MPVDLPAAELNCALSGVGASGSKRQLFKVCAPRSGQIGNAAFPPDPADLRAEVGRRLWGKFCRSNPDLRRLGKVRCVPGYGTALVR
jgi:hypothetical protein